MNPLESDLGVYVVSGVFAILVFVVAMALLVTQTTVTLTLRTAAMFTVGFLLFMGMYFGAMAIYRGIERREEAR
jgi:hypothetical protein